MSQQTTPIWLLLIPFGLIFFLLMDEKEEKSNPSKGKEEYYLHFNKDEIFKNLIQSEGHFRNVADFAGIDAEGNMSCIVKHMADAEGHLDEAISHSLIVEGEPTSEKFRSLRNNVRAFRHELQNGDIKATEGLMRVRDLRKTFEHFNPDFDISKCKACEVALHEA